jgi:hypothetical protein
VTSFSDDFNRADGSPGANWVQVSGTWVIVSNQLSPGTTGGTVVLRCATAMATNDNYAQAKVTATTAVSHGVWCRGDPTLNSGYAVRNNGTNWALFSVVGGTFTSIGTYSAAAVVGDVVRVQAVGSAIKVVINGVDRITVTDTAVTTGTATGLRSEANTGIKFDDFSAADISSGTTASAEAAPATADALGGTVGLGAVGDSAPATATAGDAGPALTLLPAVVTVTADAVSPAVSLAVTAGTAGVTADANNAVASTSGQTSALAGQPDSIASAPDAGAAVSPAPGTTDGTASALSPASLAGAVPPAGDATASAPDAVAAVRVLAEAASVIASAMDVLFVPHLDASAGAALVSASVSPGLSGAAAFSGTASTTASAGGVLLAERGTSARERVSGRETGPSSGREPVSSVQGARPADRLSGREPSRGQ